MGLAVTCHQQQQPCKLLGQIPIHVSLNVTFLITLQRGPQGGILYHANSSMSEAAIQEAAASSQDSAQGMPGLDRPSLTFSLACMERCAASMHFMGSASLGTIAESIEEGLGYRSPIWIRPVHKANSWRGLVVPADMWVHLPWYACRSCAFESHGCFGQ